MKTNASRCWLLRLANACLYLLIAFSSFVTAGEKKIWNLVDADIRAVIEQISTETNKNFIVDPKVQGKISIISHTPIGESEVFQAFLAMVEVTGNVIIPAGAEDTFKVVPGAIARTMGLPVVQKKSELIGHDMVIEIIKVKNGPVTDMVNVIRPLISPQGGSVSSHESSNSVIIADRASNVNRLAEIIRRVDIADRDGLEIVQVDNAIPTEIVNVLNTLLNNSNSRTSSLRGMYLSADDRSHSILMSGTREQRMRLRALIAKLDLESKTTGNTKVIYIKYQRAEDLVPVLSNVIQSYKATGASTGGSNSGPNVVNALNTNTSSSSNSNTSSSAGSEIGSGISEQQRQQTGTIIGNFGVHAEPNINALIVTAPPSLMRSITTIIAQLDIRRPQVLVEAIIAELQDDNSLNMGIDWRLQRAPTQQGVVGGFSSILDSDNDPVINATAAAFAPTATGLSIGFIRNGSMRGLLTLLETDTANNILATPSIVALDNSKARIFVGEKIPFSTGSVSSGEGGGVTTSIDREEVGVGLAIVPQITVDNAVMLNIEQSADSADVGSLTTTDGKNDNTAALQRTTSSRYINTQVIVNDGDILVLGGLVRTDEKDTEVKLPVLGDIPLVGKLFSNTSTSLVKRNLMVFIRPRIMRDQAQSLQITQGKYQQLYQTMQTSEFADVERFQSWDATRVMPQPFEAEDHE